MDEEEEGDFPDVAVGVIINSPYSVTRVDVDAEIKANIARKALKAKIEDEKTEFEHQESEMTEIRPLPKPKICSLPPQRQFFCEEGSFKSFNADSLTTESLSSSGPISCTSTNADEFFTWISSEITDSKEDVKCGFLQYLWLLVSCHPDPHVVQKCCDKLLECNTLWKLKYEEVVLVFYNWGVCRADFVTELVLESINAPVCCRTVVSPYNVENTLQVLNNQLSKGCLSGDHDSAKTVFLLLLLLSLDKDYQQCLTVIGDCVDQLATQAGSSNVHWVETYCEGLFRLQLHHAHLAFLSECVVPESMRWCLCLAHCQQVFSLDQSFQTQPKPLILHNILHEHFEQFLKLDSWELYSFLVIVDAGISQAVTLTSNEDIKKGFLDWLNHYMERRPERRKDDIDVDAALIAELVSRLQAEWESKWLEGSDPLEMEVDLTQKNETDLDVDSDTE